MNIKLDMNYISDRIGCTDEEKRECLETVKKIALIYQVMRMEGILAIEMLPLKDDVFLSECSSLICGAVDGEKLTEAFEILLIAGNYRGKEFLKNLVICEGLIASYNASDDGIFMRFLDMALLFGAGWRNTVMDTVKQELKRAEDAITLARKEKGSWADHL